MILRKGRLRQEDAVMLRLILCAFLLVPSLAFAGVTASIGSALDQCLTVEEVDGSPSMQGCEKLLVTNATLTDNANGTFTVTTGGGGGAGDVTDVGDCTTGNCFNGTGSEQTFTGSVPTGQRVMAAAAQEIKNVSLELGGKSPFVVFADADVAAAVEWVMFGIFWNQDRKSVV